MMAVLALTTACTSDNLSSESIFDTKAPQRSEFDEWLKKNYTDPYNIRFNYLYVDQNSDLSYNVTPASITNSIALAKIVKHVWLDAYTELMGPDFLKQHCFREFQLIGSAQYTSQGSVVLGFAEGGIRVNLFQINHLDINDIFIERKYPFRDKPKRPLKLDLNRAYFHTMHHEFAHILTQLKDYSTDFRTVSAGKFHSNDWINVNDTVSGRDGFVTGYASSEYNEDFAEVFSCYVTDTDEMWNTRLEQAIDPETGSRDGVNAILTKLDMIRSYLMNSWGVDIDKLREIVLRRSGEVEKLDLKTLN